MVSADSESVENVITRRDRITARQRINVNVDASPRALFSIGELGIPHRFSTMKIGRNVKDRKNGVVSLVTSHSFCYLHRYVLSLTL